MHIKINNVSHDFAGTVILERVQVAITAGQKIGLIGPNGCGKITLLRILTGSLEPVSGSVTRDPPVTLIGFVPQSLEAGDAVSVGEYLPAETPDLRQRLRALSELGLSVTLESPLATLSGGEQNILCLARAVIRRPDLLVLDETGNRLDFAGLAWLERYLSAYPGAVLIVSHNRYLLDQVVETIWELHAARLTEYTGTYSDCRFTRITKSLSDQATYAVQQQHLERLEELVKVLEQRARRTQLVKARKLALQAPGLPDKQISVHFAARGSRADIAMEINGFTKVFEDRVLFTDAAATVHAGEQVEIVGPNGSGKTTLRIGPSMWVGYCAQKRGRLRSATSRSSGGSSFTRPTRSNSDQRIALVENCPHV